MLRLLILVTEYRSLANSSTFQEVTFSSVYQTPTWPYKKWGIGIQFMAEKAKDMFVQNLHKISFRGRMKLSLLGPWTFPDPERRSLYSKPTVFLVPVNPLNSDAG